MLSDEARADIAARFVALRSVPLPVHRDAVVERFTEAAMHVFASYGRAGLVELNRLAVEWRAELAERPGRTGP
jgi:hypothetical protein